MHWLQSLDIALFRFINTTLQNPVFDVVMPFVSGNKLFYPFLVLLGIALYWRGDRRLRTCLLLCLLILPLGDSYICNPIKHGIARLRPFAALPEVHQLVNAGVNNSMPSSHSANWAAATMITFLFYRRSWRFMIPMALLVSFSRAYNGVHYPSDILVGWTLGAGYGFASVWGVNALWRWAGAKWFPLWWGKYPSLIPIAALPDNFPLRTPHSTLEQHWLRLGYVLIAVLLLVRLAFLAAGKLELSEDEAYQWVWSKHPALGYYSKPPMIAYTQWLGTHLWGDTVFGVRFFSPVIAAALGWMLLRFFAREFNARAGFFLLLIVTATPLLAVGATLMTVDPLSVLFWTAAMLAGWRAIREDSAVRDWLWVGLWMGLGCLSKYTALFQWLSWACVFALIPAARKQLRRPGPYLALLVNLLCFTPVIIWNAQNSWASLVHTAERGNFGDHWKPTLKYFADFMGAETFLLNPVFYIASLWALLMWCKRRRQNVLLDYFVYMGAPLFLLYLLWTFHSRVLPNWIAPAVLPLLCAMVVFWHERWQGGVRAVTRWFTAGLVLGFVAVIFMHEPGLIKKVAGRPLPAKLDESRRLQGWRKTAELVGKFRERLLAEGKPVFLIGGHYGITGQLAFNLPEGRATVATDRPLVYCLTGDRPQNQFFFWPGYKARHGENALYICKVGEKETTEPAPPAQLAAEFESVQSAGLFDIEHGDRVVRRVQVILCRGLR